MQDTIEPCHLAMPGGKTLCGRQISNGLKDLRVHTDFSSYGLMSYIICSACHTAWSDIRYAKYKNGEKQ